MRGYSPSLIHSRLSLLQSMGNLMSIKVLGVFRETDTCMTEGRKG